MSSVSDPGRPSRGDRRRIQKLIDAAYASGQLSATERSLRTQRVEAAHTRGDLAMIARDLGESRGSPSPAPNPPPSAQPSLGSAIDPETLRSMQVGGAYRGSGASPKVNIAGVANAARTVKIVVLVVVIGFLGICGLGLAAAVPSFIEGFRSGYSSTPSAVPSEGVGTAREGGGASATADLHSAVGWKALVAAIQDKSGSSSVYDLVVYPTYAAVGMDGGQTVQRGFYRDGAWQDSVNVQTPIVGEPVDLRQIEPDVIEKLPDDAAQRLGVENPNGTYFIVNAIPSDPKIMVYVQSDGGSQYQTYALDGTPRTF